MFGSARKNFEATRDEVQAHFLATGTRPRVLSAGNLKGALGEIGYAFRLIAQEPEILLFATVQWAVIAISYLVWVQMLDWIPQEVWDAMREASRNDQDFPAMAMNIALGVWSLLIVGVAAYPISVMNSAMSAAHFLRASGKPSTLGACLAIAYRNTGSQWAFTAVDAWITVSAIVDRLPKKRRAGERSRTALDELLYYAWKIATMGVSPSLAAGNGMLEAGSQSLKLFRADPLRMIRLRMGYSLLCWIVGIAAYFGSVYWLMFHADVLGDNDVYGAYSLVALPIAIAVSVVTVGLRPVYLIALSSIYTEHFPLEAEVTEPQSRARSTALEFVIAVLAIAIFSAVFFADQLGIRGYIEQLAAGDLQLFGTAT